MSGHSKWNNIKRKKEKTDGAKAKVFTKIGREISVAVRDGGPNPASTSFIIAKNPGRSKQMPLMPSSVKWTMFVKPCRAANSSNIAF